MLLDDPGSRATVLSTMRPDDALVETLLSYQFKRGCGGYLQNLEKQYEKYDHWQASFNGKTIVIGFRCREPSIPEDCGLCV